MLDEEVAVSFPSSAEGRGERVGRCGGGSLHDDEEYPPALPHFAPGRKVSTDHTLPGHERGVRLLLCVLIAIQFHEWW